MRDEMGKKWTEAEASEKLGYVPNWVRWGHAEPKSVWEPDCAECGRSMNLHHEPARITGKGWLCASCSR
jgi:hypothetical protein